MNANAQTRRCCICDGDQSHTFSPTEDSYLCHRHAQAGSNIIESPHEQLWADFCTSLAEPVFLLANTGFGDLEQP